MIIKLIIYSWLLLLAFIFLYVGHSKQWLTKLDTALALLLAVMAITLILMELNQ